MFISQVIISVNYCLFNFAVMALAKICLQLIMPSKKCLVQQDDKVRAKIAKTYRVIRSRYLSLSFNISVITISIIFKGNTKGGQNKVRGRSRNFWIHGHKDQMC